MFSLFDLVIVLPDSIDPYLLVRAVSLARTMFDSSQPHARVLVSVIVGFLALPGHLIISKLTFVHALCSFAKELTLSLSDAVAPVAFIPVSVAVLNSAESVLLTLFEGSFITFLCCFELSFPRILIVDELTYIGPVFILKGSIAILHACYPVAVVVSTFCKSHPPYTVNLVVFHFS